MLAFYFWVFDVACLAKKEREVWASTYEKNKRSKSKLKKKQYYSTPTGALHPQEHYNHS